MHEYIPIIAAALLVGAAYVVIAAMRRPITAAPDLAIRIVAPREDLPPVRIALPDAPAEPIDPNRRYESIWNLARFLMPPSGTVCLIEAGEAVDGTDALQTEYHHACGYRLTHVSFISRDEIVHRVRFAASEHFARFHEAEIRFPRDEVDARGLWAQIAQMRGRTHVYVAADNGQWIWYPLPQPRQPFVN